jgi:choline dehydrogenase
MAQYAIEEQSPGDEVQTDDDWRAFIRETSLGVYHPAGTCKMGNDGDAVVDHRLQVHGIDGLYVVDASIMPFVVSGNLNANCLMIGEKAADMIRSTD